MIAFVECEDLSGPMQVTSSRTFGECRQVCARGK